MVIDGGANQEKAQWASLRLSHDTRKKRREYLMTKVLVTYASEHGSTAQIAQSIAKVLRDLHLDVSAKRIEAVHELGDYDAIVLGSAIYQGDWLPQAEQFLETHQSTLRQKALWLFSSGPTGTGDALSLVNGVLIPPRLEGLVASLQAREICVFHGKIDLRRLPPEARAVIKAAALPRGDFRDWEAIKAWSKAIAQALTIHALTIQPA
jgi:menaquinone-dependent protoporphyrinogen oxidase